MIGRPTQGDRRCYRFLDLRVAVESERPEALEMLDGLYGRFRDVDETHPPDLTARVTSRPQGGATLEIGQHVHPLAPPPLTDFHAYSLIFSELLHRVESFFFVHGAAVSDGEHTVVLSGPSGYGKTTQSVALLARGFRMLSDDFAPLSRRDGRIHPFPKRIGIQRNAGTSPDVGDASPHIPFGDKWLVDPESLGGEVEEKPCRLTHLALLGPDPMQGTGSTFRLALVTGEKEFAEELDQLAGLSWSSIRTPGGHAALEVEVDGQSSSLAAFHELCTRYWAPMIYFEPRHETPRFQREPSLRSIGGFQAAMALLREVLNRAPQGRLLASVGGNMSTLLQELASHLDGVRCARLTPGDREATAERIHAWVQEGE